MGISRDDILELGRPKSEEVEVKGLGKVAIRQLDFRELSFFREMLRSDDAAERRRAVPWVVARGTLDTPNGARLFATDADIEILTTLHGGIVSELFEAITRYTQSDAEAVGREGKPSPETSGAEPK